MSKETIYREDAIKAVENVSENYTKEGDREWHPHIDFITQALVQVPSVSPKQGEWVWHEDEDICNCSRCDFEIDATGCIEPMEYVEVFHYCPNCGARMKGADDDRERL